MFRLAVFSCTSTNSCSKVLWSQGKVYVWKIYIYTMSEAVPKFTFYIIRNIILFEIVHIILWDLSKFERESVFSILLHMCMNNWARKS